MRDYNRLSNADTVFLHVGKIRLTVMCFFCILLCGFLTFSFGCKDPCLSTATPYPCETRKIMYLKRGVLRTSSCIIFVPLSKFKRKYPVIHL